ncbi:MAG: FMN-binding protein [Candidatus Omnitrophota bacterium]
MNKLIRFSLVLLLVNMVAASILAGVYTLTKSKIEEEKRSVEEGSLKEVMPEGIADRLEPNYKNDEIIYWKAYKGSDEEVKGYVFIAKKYGYSSVIESMVGMKKDGTITGVRILAQSETPGLGAKIVEVASTNTILKAIKNLFSKDKKKEEKLLPYFTEQFKGLNAKKLSLSSNIQAITGATISSKACLESIKEEAMEILNDR